MGGMMTMDEEYENYTMCECEQDWNCPLHQGGYTWIETRYQGLDDERDTI